jgi:hypothetical protein
MDWVTQALVDSAPGHQETPTPPSELTPESWTV